LDRGKNFDVLYCIEKIKPTGQDQKKGNQMKLIRKTFLFTLTALVAGALISGCSDGSGEPGDKNSVADYMGKAEETACLDNKIVSASQTTRTGSHTDPINGILVVCEDGTLDWIHD
jgi:hypothetical protein